jgi:hypothetical protein
MTMSQSGPAVVSEYRRELSRPRPLFEALRQALESFVVHFWLF